LPVLRILPLLQRTGRAGSNMAVLRTEVAMRRVVLAAVAVLGIALAQRDTFVQENFDGAFPPSGWSVSSGLPGLDYWHQQTGYPWTGNTTPYVDIEYAGAGDHTDTLFAPVLDCSRHRNIDLRCSTYFRPNLPMTYTARIIASIDGGVSWYTIRDYFNDSVGPALEQIDVDSAGLHSDVRVAWVWSGNLQNIVWWCIDNVTLLGTPVFDTNIAVRRVVSPRRHEMPGQDIYPAVIVKNRGFDQVNTIPVYARIFYGSDSSYAVAAVIDSLLRGEEDTVTFVPPFNTVTETTYSIRFYCDAPGDTFHDNDTLWRTFTVSDTDYYYFDNDTVTGRGHWASGNSGWGLRVSPAAPCQIRYAEFNLLPNGVNGRNYKLRILDDDGTGGAPGTVLYESPLLLANSGWNQTQLASRQITVSSGTFYLFYIQTADWPFGPELCHDTARSGGAEYWALRAGTYSLDTDTLNGDWMIRCMLDYNVGGASDSDARAVYVNQPDDELSLRPAGVQFIPEGRIENHGRMDLSDLVVACSIYNALPTPTLVYSSVRTLAETLHQDEGRMVAFDSWLPPGAGTYDVQIRTLLTGDQDTSNDMANKTCIIYRSYYTGGPEQGLNRYHWIDSDTLSGPVYSWIDTTSDFTTLIQNDADLAVTWPIGFTFYYRGQPYGYFRVCNNGWLSFNTSESPNYNNDSIPQPGSPNNTLYPFWDHLRAGYSPANRVCSKTFGVEPNRKLVVIWQGLRFYDSPDWSDPVTFELILEEATNLIYFQYKDVDGGLATHDYGRSATVGIENSDGFVGLQYLYGDDGLNGRWPGNKLTAGRAVLFYPEIRDMAVTAIDSPSTIAAPGLITPRARILNDGSFVEPCYAYFKVRSTSGTMLWLDSVLVQNLAIQKETTYTFNQWNAAFGTYATQCSVALPFDIDSSNNFVNRTVAVQAWLPRADIPRGIYNKRVKAGALAFGYPYIYALKGANTNEFWRYDLMTDTWTAMRDLPAGLKNKRTKDGCYLTASESLVYATKGGNTREFYAYSPTRDTWTIKESLPWWPSEKGARNGTCMVYANGQVLLLKGNNTNEVWSYNPVLDTWLQRRTLDTLGYPLRVKRGASLAYPGHDSLVYLFPGNSYSFLTYNASSDTWHNNWPVPRGPANKRVKAGAGSACVNDRIYLLKGGNVTEFWCYNIATDTWKQRSDIPLGANRKRVKTGGAMTASNDYIYAFKGGNTTEFWLYAPLADTGGLLAAPAGFNVEERPVALPIAFECKAGPNPSSGPVMVRLALPRALSARIGVYDIAGKLVARVSEGALPAGVHNLSWSRRDAAGRLCASGVYILKFESGQYQATRKLVLQ
jgi:hypothetical protein